MYPTETFFALGSSALNSAAVDRIFSIKSRPPSKPLPLIIGEAGQLEMLSSHIRPILIDLAERFWPGPLSILLPGRPGLPEGVQNREGLVCVRLSSHTGARSLCLNCGFPLTASSANLSGGHPAARLEQIDPDLCRRVDCILDTGEAPRGNAPSTIIRITETEHLRIVRTGSIAAETLAEAGFRIASYETSNS